MLWFKRRHPKGGGDEDLAAAHLETNGLRILDRNAASSLGEIDIVAEEKADGTVVFVEVKGRKSPRFGSPEASVGRTKQRRMVQLAEAYLHSKKLTGRPVRFDVVAIEGEGASKELRHIVNAISIDRI